MDLEAIRKAVAGHSLVRAVDQLPTGPVRFETAFLYPEGSSVDLFMVEDGPLLPAHRLSDLGNTMAWLHDVQVKPWLSKKRQQFLSDAIRTHGVVQRGGALERTLHTGDELMPGLISLGQACIRAADLVYTRRSSLQVPVNEDVEELLADTNLPFEADVVLDGRFGPVRVDFRKWFDLDMPNRSEERVTVFDDRHDVYRDEDLRRLREKSTVIALSDRVALADVLKAA